MVERNNEGMKEKKVGRILRSHACWMTFQLLGHPVKQPGINTCRGQLIVIKCIFLAAQEH